MLPLAVVRLGLHRQADVSNVGCLVGGLGLLQGGRHESVQRVIARLDKACLVVPRHEEERAADYDQLQLGWVVAVGHQPVQLGQNLPARIIRVRHGVEGGRLGASVAVGRVELDSARAVGAPAVGASIRLWHQGNYCHARGRLYWLCHQHILQPVKIRTTGSGQNLMVSRYFCQRVLGADPHYGRAHLLLCGAIYGKQLPRYLAACPVVV